ncbi:tRNA (adenosine(37)-N6)-threonylcarbamoyltransferase complex dimerization subunit type 1 TsaB [Subtercola lobariae]|uniref:tRNA (Adenosine(37)-N6)-threonylcarbamoyltransferase complex dimerization subunit type 1 TsaB n=1 Tax=Subtercola lobariae TaxID=1588641 RepID=A0A917B3Y3_9MICO|nr:tRNA (adenosine(37)-N6)-threonylcarbamoyltransferase complex dimerization subunit type 1 TsaB [Subtercola lobariae]GGF20100.1 tRNA (adenosine(37)-N6)-threonylcarbamoyltransferase complex dimerization subunit type 1 TsaB [Subtercola lobariae]
MSDRRELLLAIDTSAGTSVAVVEGDYREPREVASSATAASTVTAGAHHPAAVTEATPHRAVVLSEANGFDTMKHAEVIGRLIEQALAEASIRPQQLTGVVAGMGPGPFTGLRVGIAAANAFALGLGLPVLRVVSHDAIAFAAQGAGRTGEVLVVSDARRREVYWSLFDLSGQTPVRIDGPGLAKPDALPHVHAATLDAAHVSAGALGQVALEMLRTGAPFAADQALYLRSPDVTLSTGVKRVTQR